jgi:hypothetical protein
MSNATYITVAERPPEAWTTSGEAVSRELERIRRVPFFEFETSESNSRLVLFGEVYRIREHGGRESLRLRLVYPFDFPLSPIKVYDADRCYIPSANGHLFPDYELCLQFPPRAEFSSDAETQSLEILGASLNWMIKRNLYEASSPKVWPEEHEPHGHARPWAKLARDRAVAYGNYLLEFWVDCALKGLHLPSKNESCCCGSGKPLSRCHLSLAALLQSAIHHAKREGLNGL